MKKTLVAIAAIAAATGAMAQSTVTVSGIMNYGVHKSADGLTTYGALKGDRSKINFNVVEDMEGGAKALAMAEIRFNSANGASYYSDTANSSNTAKGASLMEQAMVGLSDSTLGTVKFGRFTNVIGVYDFSVFEDSKYGTNASLASYGRLSAQAQYDSPTLMGLTASVLSASKSANQYGAGYGWGPVDGPNYSTLSATGYRDMNAIALTYVNGPLAAQLSSINGLYNDKNTKFGINYTTPYGKFYYGYYKQNGDVGSVNATQATALYATPGKYVANTVTDGTATGVAAHTAQELGAYVPYGKFGFRAGYVRNNQDVVVGVTDGSTKATKMSLGAEYSFTKRTMLIAQHGKVTNGAATANGTNGGGFNYTTGTMSFLGMQHSF